MKPLVIALLGATAATAVAAAWYWFRSATRGRSPPPDGRGWEAWFARPQRYNRRAAVLSGISALLGAAAAVCGLLLTT